MEIAGLNPLLDDGIHHLCRDPLLAKRLGIALERRHHLAFDKRRHVFEPLFCSRLPRHLRPLLLQRVRDFAPHLELHVHRRGGYQRTESLLGRRPLDAPAAQLPAVGGEVRQPRLGFRRPGEVMLEGLRAERMAISDLDSEPLQKGGVDRLRGASRARLRRVLSELACPARRELFLRPAFHFVEAADPVLGPAGRGLARRSGVLIMVAVRLHRCPDHLGRVHLECLVHHHPRVHEAALDDVARDGLGPDLSGELLHLGASHHPHEATRHALHPLHRLVGPGQRRLAGRLYLRYRVADDLGHRSIGLVQVRVGKVSGDAGKPLHPGDLFDAGLDPAPLVALRNAVEDILGLCRPLDLEAVEGFLFLDAALPGRHRHHRRLVNRLKAGALADRARLRFLHPGWTPMARAACSGITSDTARSMIEELMIECPRSIAYRQMAVRVMARKAAGTFSILASASSVQATLASACTSMGGTKVRLDRRTLTGASRSRLSLLLPRSIWAAEWTPIRPITSSQGGSWRTYCSTFLKALPSSSVVLISMPSSRATDCATRRCDS